MSSTSYITKQETLKKGRVSRSRYSAPARHLEAQTPNLHGLGVRVKGSGLNV